MDIGLKVPFLSFIKGGGVMTFVGTVPDQCVYWSLEAIDPRTTPGQTYGPWAPVGTLLWERSLTDKTNCATNGYLAPKHSPLIRVGMGYKVGEVVVGQLSGLWDRLTAKAVLT